jgi:hypothetical protein
MRRGTPFSFLAFLAIGIAFLNGCASVPLGIPPSLLKDIEARRPPAVRVGPQMVLQDPAKLSWHSQMAGLIGKGGSAHVFFTDEKKQVHHIEISGDDVAKREVLGTLESPTEFFNVDAVEHPADTIRVAAGDKMFVRTGNDPWREIKGNRCDRFIPAGNDLLCSFVIRGEDIGAPERRDYVIGFVILFPIFWWSDVRAEKLVIAQETEAGWAIRAVVDPKTELSARDYVMGTDRDGFLHVLYRSSGGNYGFIAVGAGGKGIVDGGDISEKEIRYFRVPLTRLLSPAADPAGADASGRAWLPLEGAPLPPIPFVGKSIWGNPADQTIVALSYIGPLNRHFTVSSLNGDVLGLFWPSLFSLDDGQKKIGGLGWSDDNMTWVQVRIGNGRWAPEYDIVAVDKLPDPEWVWGEYPARRSDNDRMARITTDCRGGAHALLYRKKKGVFEKQEEMAYFVKTGPEWSAPLILGNKLAWMQARALSIDERGRVFAAWFDAEKRIVGRWILPE